MMTIGKQINSALRPLSAAAAVALLGLMLTSCSPADTAAPADTTSAASPSIASMPAAPAASTPASTAEASQHNVSVKVTGALGSALVKTVVVGSNEQESGGEMQTQPLPYSQEFTADTESGFTKVFVLAKYDSGQTADISCSITVDGKEVTANNSSNHQPAECLFINPGNK